MEIKKPSYHPDVQGQIERKKPLGVPQEVAEVQAAVQKTTTKRDESFVRDYYSLGLHKRWGRLSKEQEQRYRAQ